MSLRDAAEKLEVAPGSVATWESGKFRPRANKLPDIARVYNCNTEDFLEVYEEA